MENDLEFAERVHAAGSQEAILALLQDEGFNVTPQEMRNAVLDRYGDTLTSEQLDQLVAGVTEESAIDARGVTVVTAAAAAAAATLLW
jgi:predicted ribosomally synthesized peptide with nif11-like leader